MSTAPPTATPITPPTSTPTSTVSFTPTEMAGNTPSPGEASQSDSYQEQPASDSPLTLADMSRLMDWAGKPHGLPFLAPAPLPSIPVMPTATPTTLPIATPTAIPTLMPTATPLPESSASDESAVTPPPESLASDEPTATPSPESPAPDMPPPEPAAPKVVYLTFDDGPNPQWTPQVLEVLARYQAHATFFVIGKQAKWFPEIIKAELDAGHAVAQHTYSHHTLVGMDWATFAQEVANTEAALEGQGIKCLRPPGGEVDANTRPYADELGYRLVLWDIDPKDWKRPGADVIAERVLAKIRPGAIVLMHDGGGDRAQTIEALEKILPALSERGYTFVPISP